MAFQPTKLTVCANITFTVKKNVVVQQVYFFYNKKFLILVGVDSLLAFTVYRRRMALQRRKWTMVSSSIADLQTSLNGRLSFSAWLSITQWPLSMATVIEMMLWPSPSNWLVCLYPFEGQVSLVVSRTSHCSGIGSCLGRISAQYFHGKNPLIY